MSHSVRDDYCLGFHHPATVQDVLCIGALGRVEQCYRTRLQEIASKRTVRVTTRCTLCSGPSMDSSLQLTTTGTRKKTQDRYIHVPIEGKSSQEKKTECLFSLRGFARITAALNNDSYPSAGSTCAVKIKQPISLFICTGLF